MSSLVDFSSIHLPQVEAVMTNFLAKHTSDTKLLQAMDYSIKAGGKRIRPLLLLSLVAGFTSKISLGDYQAAAAVEMIHTYSLIHDDLPAMDDDDLRRGQATNHKVFGEATAILAGDGLLTSAFQLLAAAEMPDDAKIQLIAKLSTAAGTEGMVAGQSADIQGEQQQLSLEELMAIHKRKTGALIEYSIVAGGIVTKQNDATLVQLKKIAQHLGLAFQIRDDLLDVLSTTEELGKNIGRDQELAKSTYPSLLGLEEAQAALQEELSAARKLSQQIKQTVDFDESLLEEIISSFELKGKRG